MIHLDLFSGIGSFAYAVDQVWPDAEHIFCEVDPFCQAVLKKHWKGAKIYGDIRTLTMNTRSGGLCRQEVCGEQQRGTEIVGSNKTYWDGKACDILTGGFPCQPFSTAGKRRGKADDRYLWPEMLRVIREFKPTWIIGENVAGIVKMALNQVLSDLEGEGYATQTFIIPACSVNAPHRRDRVWIIAHNANARIEGMRQERKNAVYENAPDTKSKRLSNRDARTLSGQTPDKECERPVERYFASEQFDQNWLEVATRLCGVDDGLPARVDGLELTKSRHRIERLKALGNAIVPQVAIEIMKGIATLNS